MIASLRGVITEKTIQRIILEVNGVGYGVITTLTDQLGLHTGEEATLHIYEHIKEDAHDLFGFCNVSTKQLFEQLISVKNVGPKVALSVLDLSNADFVRSAIANGDVKYLQTAKGVGKRAAEQIVVELRDKVGAPVGDAAEGLVNRSGIHTNDEAVLALMALGYSDVDAQSALQHIDANMPTEDRIRQALSGAR